MNQQVADIAEEVRDWAEELAQQEGRREDLNGLCAIATAELCRRYSRAGITSKICLSEEDYGFHVYLRVEDHIVCVTATQFPKFRNVPVLIMHEKELEDEEYYRNYVTFKDVAALIKYQTMTGWPQEQIARRAS